MSSAYQQWTTAYALGLIRRELMDPNAKWWSDAELTLYLDNWQNELQQEYGFVWGSSSVVTALNTITLSSISPPMDRLDAVYFGTGTSSGYRLSGRLIEDLEILNPEWRSDSSGDAPRAVVQYDSTQLVVWPPLSTAGTFTFEYPQRLSLTSAGYIQLPIWSQYSSKYYVVHRAYLRPGPTNDPQRAMRYKVLYEKSKSRVKLLWDNWLPERFRRLKPGGHYEWDILRPPPAWATGVSGPSGLAKYLSFLPRETPNGFATAFSIPSPATDMKVYKNGLLQTPGVDYAFSSSSVTSINFTSPPEAGSLIVVWVYLSGT